jgi:hypothetical protein
LLEICGNNKVVAMKKINGLWSAASTRRTPKVDELLYLLDSIHRNNSID